MVRFSAVYCGHKGLKTTIVVDADAGYFVLHVASVHVHRRLWLTPNDGRKAETLNCYDFEPTGTNDMRSLVAKVNRKLSRNQFKGLNVLFSVTIDLLSLLSTILRRNGRISQKATPLDYFA